MQIGNCFRSTLTQLEPLGAAMRYILTKRLLFYIEEWFRDLKTLLYFKAYFLGKIQSESWVSQAISKEI